MVEPSARWWRCHSWHGFAAGLLMGSSLQALVLTESLLVWVAFMAFASFSFGLELRREQRLRAKLEAELRAAYGGARLRGATAADIEAYLDAVLPAGMRAVVSTPEPGSIQIEVTRPRKGER